MHKNMPARPVKMLVKSLERHKKNREKKRLPVMHQIWLCKSVKNSLAQVSSSADLR